MARYKVEMSASEEVTLNPPENFDGAPRWLAENLYYGIVHDVDDAEITVTNLDDGTVTVFSTKELEP